MFPHVSCGAYLVLSILFSKGREKEPSSASRVLEQLLAQIVRSIQTQIYLEVNRMQNDDGELTIVRQSKLHNPIENSIWFNPRALSLMRQIILAISSFNPVDSLSLTTLSALSLSSQWVWLKCRWSCPWQK